jgi:hypothetical protein
MTDAIRSVKDNRGLKALAFVDRMRADSTQRDSIGIEREEGYGHLRQELL